MKEGMQTAETCGDSEGSQWAFSGPHGGQRTEATGIVVPCDLELRFPMDSEEPGALTGPLRRERA